MKNETLKGVFVIRGPSKKNFTQKFDKQSKLGWGPSKENFTQKFNKQSKLGWGPQQKEFHPEIQQAKQAGVVQYRKSCY
ncbi:hypothetical protein ACEE03_10690 [Staphylococcus borealis]